MPNEFDNDMPYVHLIQPEPGSQHGLLKLLHDTDFRVTWYENAEMFLSHQHTDDVGCLVTELHLPGMSSLSLLSHLHENKVHLPVLIISMPGDVKTAVEAMRAGAVDFIERPFSDRLLIKRIRQAARAYSFNSSNSEL